MDIISTRRDEFLHAITVRGEIDLATAGDLLLRFMMLVGSATEPIALDLSQVTFIDCEGLRTLIAIDRHVRATGGSLRVAVASPPVTRLFELAGMPAYLAHLSAPPGLDPPQHADTSAESARTRPKASV